MPKQINIEELTKETLKDLQVNINKHCLILKFSATWCKPCEKFKSLWESKIDVLPESVKIVDVDIDESLELYIGFKSKKMISGVPTAMLWYKKEDEWYIPSVVISGTNEKDMDYLIDICYKEQNKKKIII